MERYGKLLHHAVETVKRVYKYLFHKGREVFGIPELKLLPGHLTLFLVLSLIPILVLTGYTASYFNIPADDIVLFLQGFLPVSVVGFLVPTAEKGPSIPSGIWMVTAFLIASNGMHAILVSSDTLFGFKHRTYIIRRFKALLITMMLLIIVVFAMISVSSGLTVVRYASLHGDSQCAFSVLRFLKWPSILSFLFLTIRVVHMVTPRQRIPGKYTNLGALFTTFLWGGVTMVYTFYLKHFNNSYNALFGEFANMVVLMMWMYILSYIFVLGIAINVYSYKKGMRMDEVETN